MDILLFHPHEVLEVIKVELAQYVQASNEQKMYGFGGMQYCY
jgi:hypothetical protein